MELDKVLEEILDEEEVIECIVCETIVEMYWDSNYSGFRASCKVCGINWAES